MGKSVSERSLVPIPEKNEKLTVGLAKKLSKACITGESSNVRVAEKAKFEE